MITYVNRCNNCNHTFESKQSIKEDKLLWCPECGKPALDRVMQPSPFILNGSDWYKNENKK